MRKIGRIVALTLGLTLLASCSTVATKNPSPTREIEYRVKHPSAMNIDFLIHRQHVGFNHRQVMYRHLGYRFYGYRYSQPKYRYYRIGHHHRRVTPRYHRYSTHRHQYRLSW